MYGTQTSLRPRKFLFLFENDVKMYGTQTVEKFLLSLDSFENDVKMYGTQTIFGRFRALASLRMM